MAADVPVFNAGLVQALVVKIESALASPLLPKGSSVSGTEMKLMHESIRPLLYSAFDKLSEGDRKQIIMFATDFQLRPSFVQWVEQKATETYDSVEEAEASAAGIPATIAKRIGKCLL